MPNTKIATNKNVFQIFTVNIEALKKQLMEVTSQREKEQSEYKQLKDQMNMLQSQVMYFYGVNFRKRF